MNNTDEPDQSSAAGPLRGAPRSVLLVTADEAHFRSLAGCLRQCRFRVSWSRCWEEAAALLTSQKPDCIILDADVPDEGWNQLSRLLGTDPQRTATELVAGTDGERLPANVVLDEATDPAPLCHPSEGRLRVRFWGVRGTLPVPGRGSVQYGGNTSCVSLEIGAGPLLVFDAGTGIKALADYLQRDCPGPVDARIFISHPHWDHINALPFFQPLYDPGSSVQILGPCHGGKCVEDFIKEQMDGIHFPITAKALTARVTYRMLHEESVPVGPLQVHSMLLSHPGHCLGYRVEHGSQAVCYVTDNEMFPPGVSQRDETYLRRLRRFIHGADVLITDSTYLDEEYRQRVNWGHSPVSEVVDLAHGADIGTLCLFHHDPDQDDSAITAKLEQARSQLAALGSQTLCIAPAEGQTLEV